MEWDADLRPLSQHWEIKIPRFYNPLTQTHHLTPRGIGKSAEPNNLVIYTTHSSDEARRHYLRMVSLIERERYYSQYAHSVFYTHE